MRLVDAHPDSRESLHRLALRRIDGIPFNPNATNPSGYRGTTEMHTDPAKGKARRAVKRIAT
jgi:hypothetical protein